MSQTITAAQITAALGAPAEVTTDPRLTQPAQMLETFYQPTDPDFAAAMVRAAKAGAPFVLGPRTYVVNAPLTRGLAYWMVGTRGATVVQRTAFNATPWLYFDTDVIADGIVFDGGANVMGTQGGVTVTGATRAHFHRCQMINNRGPVAAQGSGLYITGPSNQTVIPDYLVDDCDMYNNAYAGMLAANVQQITIQNCRAHDNDWTNAPAISVTAFGTVGSVAANARISIRGNRCWHGAHGIVLDGNGSPIDITHPLSVDLLLDGNMVWDVTGYCWKPSAANMKVTNNTGLFSAMTLATPHGNVAVVGGGADYTATTVRTHNNSVRVINSSASNMVPWGFDYGGCQDVIAVEDTVDGAQTAFSCGATIRTRLHLCSGKNFQIGVVNPGVDSGAGIPKNQISRSVTVDTCQFEINGPNATGVSVYAGSQGFRLLNTRFYGINGAGPNQAITARVQFSSCAGNEWEDSSQYLVTAAALPGDPWYVPPGGTMPPYGTLTVPDVFDSVYIREQPRLSSYVLMTQATFTCQNKIVQVQPYGAITINGNQISLSPGAGYTTMNIADGQGNVYAPFITSTGATVQYQGQNYNVQPGGLLGARPTTMVGNFASNILMSVTGDGSGAVLAGMVGVPPPLSKRLLVKTGPGVTVSFSTGNGISIGPLGVAEAIEVDGQLAWQ